MGERGDRIVWRGLYRAGHEFAHVRDTGAGWEIDGVAVFVDGDAACRLDYTISCDPSWTTRRVAVTGWVGADAIERDIVVTDDRVWRMNGEECREVLGCVDIDLNFSPVTNLLPIRRCQPEIGSEVAVTAAWLRYPSFALEPLEQTYRRLDVATYRYTSGGGAFTADLVMNGFGLVVTYPGGWVRE